MNTVESYQTIVSDQAEQSKPSLQELAGASQATFPDAPIELAMIADSPPTVLSEAINVTGRNYWQAHYSAEDAEIAYEMQRKKSGPNVDAALQLAAQIAVNEERRVEKIKPSYDLSQLIMNQRNRLSRTYRWGVSTLGAFTLGVSGAVYMDHDYPVAKPQNAQEIHVQVTNKTESIALAGGAGVLLGGLVGGFIGIAGSSSVAHRKAKKILTT